MITPALLRLAVGCTPDRAALFAGHLDDACRFYDITAPDRLAAFLAQIGHESGSFRWVREIADGSAYEGRRDLDNTQPGDGTRYRGRGLIQCTGRANYRQMAQLLAHQGCPDFEADPEALELPQWAAWSAAAWWSSRHLNALADAGDFDAITRRINGGTNGAADRRARWDRARAALVNQNPIKKPTWPVGDSPDWPQPEKPMAIPAIVAAVLPSLIEAIPKLGKVFGSGSQVAERNIRAAELVAETVKAATGAVNEQEAAERIKSDPQARAAAEKAVDGIWYELTEAGGGGIEGARRADADQQKVPFGFLRSPSFWFTCLMVPPVYAVVGSVVGLWGQAWPNDVRSAIATAVVSLIVGGGAGYYWGQTTSRNRGTQ